jgi:glycosyltransferase involved in cell wall biosynthesis
MTSLPPVSLIMTVRDEAASLPALFDSLMWQHVRPDEIVIVDGGSTDGTQDVVLAYSDRLPLRLIELPGANISQGRNAAIRASKYDIIAATDAGVRLDPGWLESLVRPFTGEVPHVDVVSGFFVADPQTAFEGAMGATVLPALEDVDPGRFLPSSRSVAFRKAAWEEAGGYPEWLDYCEDLVFDINLLAAGCRAVFVPEARVYFRPRSNLRAFFLQYYRYARGDGKADLWRKRHAIRYATYLLGPAFTMWAWQHRKLATGRALLLLAALSAAAYCRRPYARLLPMLRGISGLSVLKSLCLVPVIRLTGDVAKMLGYPVGILWRLKNKP